MAPELYDSESKKRTLLPAALEEEDHVVHGLTVSLHRPDLALYPTHDVVYKHRVHFDTPAVNVVWRSEHLPVVDLFLMLCYQIRNCTAPMIKSKQSSPLYQNNNVTSFPFTRQTSQ